MTLDGPFTMKILIAIDMITLKAYKTFENYLNRERVLITQRPVNFFEHKNIKSIAAAQAREKILQNAVEFLRQDLEDAFYKRFEIDVIATHSIDDLQEID